MKRPVALSFAGVLLLVSASGCYIPTWRCQTPRPLQWAENRWGDLVDCVGHQSAVDQPWCDPRYSRVGIYRVGPYPPFGPPTEEVEPAANPAPLPNAPIPAPAAGPNPYLKPY